MENYSKLIVGHNFKIQTPYGKKRIIYADWAASGRLYKPIEDKMLKNFGPFVANTHTESNITSEVMTKAYHEAKDIIKKHVGATDKDALVLSGSGMTSAVCLLQRILGWRVPAILKESLNKNDVPIVFVSELEHHSNHTTWLETIAEVVVIPQTNKSPFDIATLEKLLKKNRARKYKVAAISACSNVTGVRINVHRVAKLMHEHQGLCFVDYTCSAPYDTIDMHPTVEEALDAIYFSPHKFLGGPGTPGVLVFDKSLYHNSVPDRPGGGTVLWTNPWGGRRYSDDIETREDGGTPAFLGAIRTALAIKLKEDIGTIVIAKREKEIVKQVFSELESIPNIHILASNYKNRLAVFSLLVDGLHYNLVTRLLNDRFGIQARGGCACAGTYGHFLLSIGKSKSKAISSQVEKGIMSTKPGFVRLSLHPTMSRKDITYITSAIISIAKNGQKWSKDYVYDKTTNEFINKTIKKYPDLNSKNISTLSL